MPKLRLILTIIAAYVFLVTIGDCDNKDPRTVRVASISFEPVKFDLAGNANKLEEWFRKAARGGAKIAVAPEGALEGYVVNQIIAGDAAAERMRDVAITIDSPTIQRFQSLARELEMCLVFGFAERINEDAFNCGVFIDGQGRIRGKYHKMQFAEGYHDTWWFNRLGQQSRAFDTPYGRCGILICNDRWNPQLAKIPSQDGAQFLVIPSFGSTNKTQDEAVLARGVENGLPVIEANVGVSLIVDHNQIVAVDRHREGVTFAEITIPDARAVDVAGRDQTEAAFLEWRKAEMPRRLAKHMARLGKTPLVVTPQPGPRHDREAVRPAIAAERPDGIAWYDAKEIGVEGKAWEDTAEFYDRLPARAQQHVREPVWMLSQNSAGICVRFVTDARTIHARWALRSANLAMPHMPATGVSGVDLYVRSHSQWRWLATGQPTQQTNTARLVHELPLGKREYLFYLPLYNGVSSVELGIPAEATLSRKSPRHRRPIVFWGTSITQGGCASRPGMVHTAILGRWLERPIINLGFSGNGKMEAEVAQLISEIDAAVYVIDCLPNLKAALVRQRTRPLVEIIRQRRPDTPILLVEDRTYGDAFLVPSRKQRNDSSRAALRAAYEAMRADGITDLYYLKGDGLLGTDGEDTVDGSHPTDLGFLRQANSFEAALRPILKQL